MDHQPISFGRRALYAGLVGLALLVLLEAGAALALRTMRGEWLSKRAYVEAVATVGEASEAPGAIRGDLWAPRWILHPYLGFGRNPEAPRQGLRGELISIPVNEHGFFGPSPVVQRSPESFTVALTGGSVALELYLTSRDLLIAELERLPAARGKRVVLVSLALGGLKQPQQLLAVNYFQAVGAAYDLVLNLDGFNEITLPIKENIEKGVHPFYPRNWSEYSATSVELGTAALYGQMATANAERAAGAARLAKAPWRHSYLGLALWELRRRGLDRRLVELEERLRDETDNETLSAQQRGPAYEQRDIEKILRDCVIVWGNASRQMSRLADGMGFTYLHFLQPNQYVEDSKPLSEFEQAQFMNLDAAYSRYALAGYPKLLAAGQRLAAEGVPFHDLTGIFRDHRETLYDDSCCHLNDRGYELLTLAMAERLRADPRLAAPPG